MYIYACVGHVALKYCVMVPPSRLEIGSTIEHRHHDQSRGETRRMRQKHACPLYLSCFIFMRVLHFLDFL
jgi:hypothetical protein